MSSEEKGQKGIRYQRQQANSARAKVRVFKKKMMGILQIEGGGHVPHNHQHLGKASGECTVGSHEALYECHKDKQNETCPKYKNHYSWLPFEKVTDWRCVRQYAFVSVRLHSNQQRRIGN